MLLTIQIADIKLANHYLDPEAIYVSDFKLRVMKVKKGLASDNLTFTLHKDIFDSLNKSFIYSCYNSLTKIYIDNELLFNGYVNKISTEKTDRVKFDIQSLTKWYFATDATPKKTAYCQNQLGSINCAIDIEKFSGSFNNVDIDGFTGRIALNIDKANYTISLGSSSSSFIPIIDGNEQLIDGNIRLYDPGVNNPMFLELLNWENAYVVINDVYKTNIVNIASDAIYLALNFTNTKLRAESLKVYLKCDKTYGICYSRFNNVQNFWGFPNNREDISTIDIFSATNLTYCGQDNEQELEECPNDHNLFGVEL